MQSRFEKRLESQARQDYFSFWIQARELNYVTLKFLPDFAMKYTTENSLKTEQEEFYP